MRYRMSHQNSLEYLENLCSSHQSFQWCQMRLGQWRGKGKFWKICHTAIWVYKWYHSSKWLYEILVHTEICHHLANHSNNILDKLDTSLLGPLCIRNFMTLGGQRLVQAEYLFGAQNQYMIQVAYHYCNCKNGCTRQCKCLEAALKMHCSVLLPGRMSILWKLSKNFLLFNWNYHHCTNLYTVYMY